MAYGRDIVIHLASPAISDEDVRQSLEKFVTVQSLTALPHASPPDAATLHATLASPRHVDHLLNVLSGKLLVGGRFLCPFARPQEDDSDEEDETLVEDLHGSFHDAFLTPPRKASTSSLTSSSMQMTSSAPSSPIAILRPMTDHSSVFLTPPHSLSSSTLGGSSTEDIWSPASKMTTPSAAKPLSSIPIGLHPEITDVDPSPYRPEMRAPRRRAAELAEIFERVRGRDAVDAAVAAPPATAEQPEEPAAEAAAFLPLPPPYHLLPNTPYFRNAPIAPPPLKPPVPPVPAQRVINRYLASMQVMDNLDEMEIQSLMCFNFNRTVGYCPYTIPEKEPLTLRHPDDLEDTIDEDWSTWAADAFATTAHHLQIPLTH